MRHRQIWSRLPPETGTLLTLLTLGVYFSVATWREQDARSPEAAEVLADRVVAEHGTGVSVLVAGRADAGDAAFADTLRRRLIEKGVNPAGVVRGEPIDARREIDRLKDAGTNIDLAACSPAAAAWGVFDRRAVPVVSPEPYSYPDFLKRENLLNIANQIAVIAIIAVGMTLVIITGGIDLSVGSLVAVSAVTAAAVIRDFAGGEAASALGMCLGAAAGVAAGTSAGVFSGTMVTAFRVPPFIVTLGMMLMASGGAWIVADGQSINDLPDAFGRLDHGTLIGVPNPIWIMAGIYAAAHLMMTRMVIGRYIYAVGGNAEVARRSGVPVRRVLIFVYAVCGTLAGVAGLIMASRFTSGDPKFGGMYELTVIAAVVVGGTSLAGGQGRVTGTLIGAFIIAVIQNGMNLMNIESYTQKVVLGSVLLAAVLIDRMKRKQ